MLIHSSQGRDCAAEDPQALAFLGSVFAVLPRPPRMMNGCDKPFRVRHEPENPARGIADARGGKQRTVRIGRVVHGRSIVLVGVLQHDLAGLIEGLGCPGIGREELSLAVSDGQLDGFRKGDER